MLKKTMKKVTLAFLLSICFIFTLAPITINASTSTLKREHTVNSKYETADILGIPTCDRDYDTYNMAVVYGWEAGSGGTKLALSHNTYYYDIFNTTQYEENAFPSSVNKIICIPNYQYGKTMNDIGQYSGVLNLEHTIKIMGTTGNIIQVVTSGDVPKYKCIAYYDFAPLPIGATVPKTFKQERFVWNHECSTGKTIRATIDYMGELRDIDIVVPSIFGRIKGVTIKGIEFEMRVGNSTVSIRTKNNGVSAFDIKFAYRTYSIQN